MLARPDTIGYRLATCVGRNRTAVAAATVVLVALVVGLVAATWQARAAQRERVLAERRFEDVRELANVALIDLHDAIRDLLGATPARQLLVTKGLEYLDKLSRDAGNCTDLRRELAGAYMKIGDVQGRPFNPNLGDAAGALASYRKAVTKEALETARRSLELLTAPMDAAPDGEGAAAAELGRELAASYTRVGDLLSATGDTTAALEHRRRALAVMEAVA